MPPQPSTATTTMRPTPSVSGSTLHLPNHFRTVVDGFHWSTLAHPQLVALIDATDGSSITYQQLAQQVEQIARVLHGHLQNATNENPDGDRLVALCLKPSPQLVAVILAVMQVGAAYVALDSGFPVPRLEHILADSRPLLLVTDPDTELPSAVNCTVILAQDLKEQAAITTIPRPAPPPSSLSPEGVAVVLYTSGSTGVPKGVRIPHRALLNRLLWQWKTFPYAEGENCCFKTALTFVDSLSEIFGPLCTGRSLLVIPKCMVGRVEVLVGTLSQHGVGRLVLVPTLLRAILLHCSAVPQEHRLPKLRLWVCSGEQFPADLLENFFDVFSNGQVMCNFYGSTEVLGDVTFIEFRDKEDAGRKLVNGSVPIGYALSNNHIYLDTSNSSSNAALTNGSASTTNGTHAANGTTHSFNGTSTSQSNGNSSVNGAISNGSSTLNGNGAVNGRSSVNGMSRDNCDNESNVSDIGEICIYGASLALGYVRIGHSDRFVRVKLAQDQAPELVYRSGDYGRVHSSGSLLFEGRKDGQIKVRGHRVDTSEVQRAVSALPQVTAAAVLCYKPGQLQQAVVAFYCSSSTEDPSQHQQELAAQLSTRLTAYMMPKLYRLPSLPLLVNGKVDRQQLLGDYGASCQESSSEIVIEDVSDPKEAQVSRDVLGVVQRVLVGGGGPHTMQRVTLQDSFFLMGGDSLNAVLAVTALRDMGYNMGLTEFVEAKNLRTVVQNLLQQTTTKSTAGSVCPKSLSDIVAAKYSSHPLEAGMQAEVIKLLAACFSQKSDMEVLTGATEDMFYPMLSSVYQDLLLQHLSFVVKDTAGVIVSVSLSFDFHAEPPVEVVQPLTWIFDMLEQVESKVRHLVPKNVGEVIHSFMMGTLNEMSTKENIQLVTLMEEHNISLAKDRKYKAIFTTNTSAATRYVCDDLLGYQTLLETPIHTYTASDGATPFAALPAHKVAACTIKYV